MSVDVRSQQQIQTDLKNGYNQLIPQLDLSEGTTERDIFVTAPSGSLADIETKIGYTYLIQSLLNWASMERDDLESICANYLGQNPRIPAKKSSGTIFAYAKSIPASDIVIPAGTQVSTIDGVSFITTAERTIYKIIISTFYNPTLGWYEVEVPVESLGTGVTQNIGPNLIKVLNTTVTGIDTVNNTVSTTGGTDEETDQAMVTRTIASFQSRGLELSIGLQNYILTQDNVVDAFVVGAGGALMVRDDGLGGMEDIYIRGTVNTTFVETVTLASTGIILSKAPFLSMISLIGSSVYVEGVDFNVVRDPLSSFYKSSREQVRVIFTSTGPIIGESITVTYSYNSLMDNLYAIMQLPVNHIINSDLLFFETDEILINFTMNVYITGDQATIDSNIRTSLTNAINNLTLGSKIEKADMFAIVKNIPGIDNLPLSTFVMDSVPVITPDVNGDMQLSSRQYSTTASINITYIL